MHQSYPKQPGTTQAQFWEHRGCSVRQAKGAGSKHGSFTSRNPPQTQVPPSTCSRGHRSCRPWTGQWQHPQSHSPHMTLQIWRTLISGFWKSQYLVTETQTHSSSREVDRSSSCALHSPLHGRSSPALGVAQTDCQGWKSSQREPLALGDTGQAALEEGQERHGLCLLLEVCCHLPRDTPLPVS